MARTASLRPLPPTVEHRDEFEDVFRDYYPRVVRLVRRHFPGLDAEEVAQETLTRCFVHYDEIDWRHPWPWIATTAKNVAVNVFRRNGRLVYGDPDPDLFGASSDGRPFETTWAKEQARLLLAALRRLRPSDRQLIELYDLDGLDSAEIAARRDVNQNALRQQICRARQRLLAEFKALGGALGLGGVLRGLFRFRRRKSVTVAAGAPPAVLACMTAAVVGGAVVAGGGFAFGPPGRTMALAPHRTAVTDVARVRDISDDAGHGSGSRPVAASVAGRGGGLPPGFQDEENVSLGAGPAAVKARTTGDPWNPHDNDGQEVEVWAGEIKVIGLGHHTEGMPLITYLACDAARQSDATARLLGRGC